jgi:cytochrome c553
LDSAIAHVSPAPVARLDGKGRSFPPPSKDPPNRRPEVARPNKQVVGTPPPATQTCVSCHGADGAKTIGPDYPILAAQYPDYIVHALQDYKSGKRKNPIMAGVIAGIDAKDFEAIAQFFGQQPGLCSTDQLRKHGKCEKPEGG